MHTNPKATKMDKILKALGSNDISLNIGVSRFSSPFCFPLKTNKKAIYEKRHVLFLPRF